MGSLHERHACVYMFVGGLLLSFQTRDMALILAQVVRDDRILGRKHGLERRYSSNE